MTLRVAAFLFAVVAIPVQMCGSPQVAEEDVAQQLNSRYANNVLMLRHFYQRDHLSFQPDGTLIGSGETGPWTVFGQIFVKSIELRAANLNIKGRRVNLIFDDKTKSFRDVLQYVEEQSKASPPEHKKKKHGHNEQKRPDWDALTQFYLNQIVEIDIALRSENPGVQEVSAALAAVFMKPEEPMADLLPDFWRDYFDGVEGRPPRSRERSEPVYRITPGAVLPPRPIYSPEPEFSEYARLARYQGTATLALVVDSSGNAMDVQISTPIGLGLDDKGVEAVRNWKFEPARRGGKAVAVNTSVEIDFHLY